MLKSKAVRFFGGVTQTATAIGVSQQAIDRWPLILTKGLELKVLGASFRAYGSAATRKAFPASFESSGRRG